jgi:hypothetical protein
MRLTRLGLWNQDALLMIRFGRYHIEIIPARKAIFNPF